MGTGVSLQAFCRARGIRTHAALITLLGVYILIRSAYWACPPIWDGMIFYSSLLKANAAPFDLLNYSTDNHVCQGMLLLTSLPYAFFKRDYFLFNIWLTTFGVLSTFVFYKIIEFFSEGRLRQFELALITALFAFHPSILASMIHFSLDIGVVTFFLCSWLFLLRGWTIPALVSGILLVFAKETGWFLLPFPFLFCLFLQPPADRRAWAKRYWVAVLVPFLTLAAFLAYKTVFRAQPALWREYHDNGFLATLKQFFSADRKLSNFLVMIFVMNFNWLLSLTAFAELVLVTIGASRREPAQLNRSFLLYLLFLGTTAVVLLVRPYSNVRYVMVLFPLLIVCLLQWALVLRVSRGIRLTATLVLLSLFAASNLRTVDPLSKAYFGTFTFGKHELLAVARQTSEPGAWGRDQLVYNLEFLKFPQLVTKIMQDLRPSPQTFILNHPAIDFNHPLAKSGTLTRLDCVTYKPTFELKGSFVPQYTTADKLLDLDQLPAEVYYLAFPNCDYSQELNTLATRYPGREDRIYDIDGYEITVVHFKK